MNIFLSWSGERSKKVAHLLDEWLQCVIQRVKPWMSSKDIDRGTIWFSEINDQLKATSIGIICLTRENLNKPWILFEAGALLKGLSSSRLCTLLIDLQPADITDPLAQFNHTNPNKEGMWGLVRTLNNQLIDERISEKILEKIFDTYWGQFEEEFKIIISETSTAVLPKKKDNNEIMYELLNSVRMMDKRMRSIEMGSMYSKEKYIIEDKIEDMIIDIIKNSNIDNKSIDGEEMIDYVINRLMNNNMFEKTMMNNKNEYKNLQAIVRRYLNKYR